MNPGIAVAAEDLRPKRRRGLVGLVAAGMVSLLAVPAALAAVWSINEVRSDWTLTDCLTKVEGKDGANFGADPASNWYINFDAASTATDPVTGAAVLQETLSVRAPAGFRTYSTDTFRVRATKCGYDFNVRLKADPTNSFGEPAVGGFWKDKGVKLYLSKTASPGNDFSNAADWDPAALTVDNSGTVVVASTGQALLADNSELLVGFELVGGSPAGATGDFRFQVEFVPLP
jgi:hypothetical protein